MPKRAVSSGDRLLQREARFERARLLARPGADPAAAGAAGEIGVGLGRCDDRDRPAQPHLAARGSSSGNRAPPSGRRAVPGPWRSRNWCRRRSRCASNPLRRTIRTFGRPSASTVASAIAFGSFGSAASASCSHSAKSDSGSSSAGKSLAINDLSRCSGVACVASGVAPCPGRVPLISASAAAANRRPLSGLSRSWSACHLPVAPVSAPSRVAMATSPEALPRPNLRRARNSRGSTLRTGRR